MPRNVGSTVNVTQDALVRTINRPRNLHREVATVEALAEVHKLAAEGWVIVECRLERMVKAAVTERRVTRLISVPAPEPHQQAVSP